MQDINTAAIYELETERIPKMALPVMSDNHRSRQLAYDWAASLVRNSGEAVTIYRNGAKQITIPVGN